MSCQNEDHRMKWDVGLEDNGSYHSSSWIGCWNKLKNHCLKRHTLIGASAMIMQCWGLICLDLLDLSRLDYFFLFVFRYRSLTLIFTEELVGIIINLPLHHFAPLTSYIISPLLSSIFFNPPPQPTKQQQRCCLLSLVRWSTRPI
jgi:hypothetical protein